MANTPSKLEPFRDFIAKERRRKTPYRQIAIMLEEQGVKVDYSTIHAFVKVRSKPQRKVITMLEPETTPGRSEKVRDVPAVAQMPAEQTGTAPDVARQRDAIERLKNAQPNARRPIKGLASFHADAPLDRISEKEARRLRDELNP